MSNVILLASIACIVISLIVCAFLHRRNELFSNALHYCTENITADNRPEGVPIASMNGANGANGASASSTNAMSVNKAKLKCDAHHKCRFFTCESSTDADTCNSATFYQKNLYGNSPVPDGATKVFQKSMGPCHNYCFEYAKPEQSGRAIQGPLTHDTLDKAKHRCDTETECDFFTCKNGTQCDDMQMFSNSGQDAQKQSIFTGGDEPSNTCPKDFPYPYNGGGVPGGYCCVSDRLTTSNVPGRNSDVCNGGGNSNDSQPCPAGRGCLPPKKEMYTKTQQACATTVNAIPTQKKATQQAYLLPYAYNVHGGMKKYSNGIAGMVATPDKVQQRVCQVDHNSKSESEHDSDCFLQGTDAWDAGYFDILDLYNIRAWWSEDEKYKFYKDKNHNVYHHKTNMCCANDVAHAKRQAKAHAQEVRLPEAHPCNNLKDTVFSTDCDKYCDDGKVYRGDLKACVPLHKKCHYENSLTCDHNSPYRASFTHTCTDVANNKEACNIRQCQKSDVNVSYQSCKDGQPYYTFVGSYDETVLLFKKLGDLRRGMQNGKTYEIIEQQTNNVFGTITDVLTINKYYFGKPLQIKLAKQGWRYRTFTYNVLSLSHELQYIELYGEHELPSDSQAYTIQEKQ